MSDAGGTEWEYAESLHKALLLLCTDNYIDDKTYRQVMVEIVNDWLDEEQGHQMLWNAGLAD